MKHFAYLLPVCCLLFAACRKDSPATEIIPAPRSVKAGQGTFDLGGGIRIAPADPCSARRPTTSHNCSGRKTSRRLRTPGTPIFRSNSIPGCRSRATP